MHLMILQALLIATALFGCPGIAETASAKHLIRAGIKALGGRKALAGLSGVTYEYPKILRVNSLNQNYNLLISDRWIVSKGAQNISYSFEDATTIKQRIDRDYQRSEYFYFIDPSLPSGSFSLVVRGGDDGFSCYVRGNNVIFFPQNQTLGYGDAALTEYLVLNANKLSPTLLLEVERHNPVATTIKTGDAEYPAVKDDILGLVIGFDKGSRPCVIRSFEDHAIFGDSTNDLLLLNYTATDGIWFSHRQLVMYNSDSLLGEATVASVSVDPNFPRDFFDGLDSGETDTEPTAPQKVEGYSHAEIYEWWTNLIWTGLYQGTLNGLSTSHPASDLPNAHHIVVAEKPDFAQMVLEFEDSLIVFEAPPHQTDLVIQYVQETLEKNITHFWPSHHHHDHSYDGAKLVALGAKVIVPEVAVDYWSSIPGAELIIFSEDEPYIHSDSNMQARFLWRAGQPHSIDWTYAIITSRCPTANSSIMAFEGDAWQTGRGTDSNVAFKWVQQAAKDGLSRNAIVVPVHGEPSPFEKVIAEVGYPYPDHDILDFKTGGDLCLDQ